MIWSWPGHRLPSSSKGELPRPGGCNSCPRKLGRYCHHVVQLISSLT
jgi:hypothetical protein